MLQANGLYALSRSSEDRLEDVLTTISKPVLEQYFAQIQKAKGIPTYKGFLQYSGFTGQVPGQKFLWTSRRLRPTLTNATMQRLYVRYQKSSVLADEKVG